MAESSASTAVAVRATVAQLIAEGRTDQQIRELPGGPVRDLDRARSSGPRLVAAGLAASLLGGLAALVALGTVLVRRRTGDRRRCASATSAKSRADRRRPRRRRARTGGRFLVQSLADADAEYLAGDLSDKDYLALRHRDMVRLSVLDVAMAGVAGGSGDTPGTAGGRQRWSRTRTRTRTRPA